MSLRYFFQLFIAFIACLPNLLFAYLGHFSRMMSDDYCTIAIGRDLGAWDGMVYWFTTWAGSYSNFFFKSAIAPIDTLAPMITPVLTIVIWLIGLCVIIWQLLGQFRVKDFRILWTIVISNAIVFATLNALYSPQSFYWFAASTHYTLPLAVLTLYFGVALSVISADFWNIRTGIIWIISGLLCFVSAGASEIFVAFQSALFTLLLGMIFLFSKQAVRKRYLLIVSIGWLATIFSLGIQLLSPGVSNRIAVEADNIVRPLTSLQEIIPATMGFTFEYIGHNEAFAGFIILFCVSFMAMWVIYKPEQVNTSDVKLKLPTSYLMLWIVVQLLYIPILWGHSSDSPQVLGRFSYGYFSVILIQFIVLLSSSLAISRRHWINVYLHRHPAHWIIFYLVIGSVIVGLFILTQLRSIHFKATNYLFVNTMLLLGSVACQLTQSSISKFAKKLGTIVIMWHGAVLILIASIIFTALLGRGLITPRILSPVSFLLVTLGIVWGCFMSILLRCQPKIVDVQPLVRTYVVSILVCLVLVTTIGIFAGQARLIPDFMSYANEWDHRHDMIIAVRDAGEQQIEVTPLPFDLADFIHVTTLEHDPANRCALWYYDVEKIMVANRL